MEFTAKELSMIIDALQFTSCCDVCTNVSEDRQMEMAELSVELSKQIKSGENSYYVSDDNYFYSDAVSEQPMILDKIKNHIRNISDESNDE